LTFEIIFYSQETSEKKLDAETAKARWREDGPHASLTWGQMLTGDAQGDIYQRHHTFAYSDQILEIGPAYGRLLQTALERRVRFGSYLGLDLSPARTEKLRARFAGTCCSFATGDVESWHGSWPFSVVLCSATLEHLFPDCRSALHNLRPQLIDDARLFLDFPSWDGEPTHIFEPRAYVRFYPRDELENHLH
jgi:SAM-dependent methyltransferase